MKLLGSDNDCGCDDNYFSVINNSPLLSGQQENDFNPDNSKTNFLNNDMVSKPPINPIIFDRAENNNNNNNNNNNIPSEVPKIELEAITQKKINDNNIGMNNNNNIDMNLTTINRQQMNTQMNNRLNNRMGSQINSVNSLNNLMNTQPQEIIVNEEPVEENNGLKSLITNTNYILMLMLALAANDVIKFYINRSIKFDNGNHKSFLYYIGALVLLIYLISRSINKYVN